MERYQHIVRFGLFGHTHDEEISVVKGVNDSKPIGINFLSGSLTTYINRNPAFTVYELDEEFMIPVSIKTYYFDLEKVNREGKPQWQLLKDFTSYYGMEDLSPSSIQGLADRIKQDEQLSILYDWNKGRQVKNERKETCDESCRLSTYCSIASSEYF